MDPAGRGLARTFSSFRARNYRLFFAGQVVSLVGTWTQRVAQDWLILGLSDSAIALSVGIALQSTPVLLFGVWGGLLVDRFDTRRLLLWAQSIMGLLALILGSLTLTGVVQLWMVYVLAFALGCVAVVDKPARQSFVTELVGAGGVANAVSLNSSMNNAARLVGPAFAGVLITAVGVAPTFMLNAVSFLAVIGALKAMDVAAIRREAPVARAPRQIREGLRYVRGTPVLLAPIVVSLAVSLWAQNFRVILPLLTAQDLNAGAATYGTLMSMLGVGALLGALACAHYARPSQRLLLLEAAGFGAVCVVAAVVPSVAALTALMVLIGAGNTAFNTTSNALVQLRSAPALRGRVLALRTVLTTGTTPVGAPIIGLICDRFGARMGLAAGGVIAVLVAVLAAGTRRLDESRADLRAAELQRARSQDAAAPATAASEAPEAHPGHAPAG